MNCFIRPTPPDPIKVALRQAEYVLKTLAGDELFARWTSGEVVAMEMVVLTRNRYKPADSI